MIGASVCALAIGSAGSAASPVVGDPVDPRPGASLNPVESSYRVEDLRVADPAGGLPWSFATFTARPAGAPGDVVCVEIGRVLDGRLGIVGEGGAVFRPYVPGSAPAVQCTLRMGEGGPRAFGVSLAVIPAQLASCVPGTTATATTCGGSERTVIAGSLGKGILGAWPRERSRGGGQFAASKTGAFLAVYPGTFTEAATPSITVQATLCGPNARRDLLRTWRATRQGCLLTLDAPSGPRPQPESAASRRARRQPALNRPVRVVETRSAAPDSRFRARLKAPITVRSSGEGYAYRLTGPTGARCDRRGTFNTSRSYTSSFVTVEGAPIELAIRAPRRSRPWCRGTYRLTILHVQAQVKNRRLAFLSKPVGSTSFSTR